jgi:ribosome biogenesis protein Tsr3
MERFGMAKILKEKERKKKFKGIVLSAFGDQVISGDDLEICLKFGICAIDCSWNKISTTG